jgi:hypothetical protein
LRFSSAYRVIKAADMALTKSSRIGVWEVRGGVVGKAVRALTLAAAAIGMLGTSAMAGIDQQYFLSRNNKLYFIIKADDSAGIGAQITSVMMTSGSAIPLTETVINPQDPVATSFSTLLTGNILTTPPLGNIKRTAIVSGLSSNDVVVENPDNPFTGGFDPNANGGDGLLTLPGGARTVTSARTPSPGSSF